MIRRSAVLVVFVAASIAPMASAADLKSNIRAVAEANKSTLKLGSLFAKSDTEVVFADGSVMAEPTYPHVMFVAVSPEGEAVSSCSVSEEAIAKTIAKAAKPLDKVKEQ
jgi:hypothetical protein